MVEGRRNDAWHHTSAVLAMLYNANRDPKRSRPKSPNDFHPYLVSHAAARRGVPITKAMLPLLRKVFCK